MGLLKMVGSQIIPYEPQVLDKCWQDLVFALLKLDLVLFFSFLAIPPFLLYEMGIFTLCHFILEVHNLAFHFISVHI